MSGLMPLDFSGEVTPLKPGTYNARIVAAEAKTSQNGNPYINWQLETFGSPEVNGRRLFHTTPTTGGWVTKLAELHRAATGEDIDKKAKQYDPNMLVGRELIATVTMRNYTAKDGSPKETLEIKSVAPLKQ